MLSREDAGGRVIVKVPFAKEATQRTTRQWDKYQYAELSRITLTIDIIESFLENGFVCGGFDEYIRDPSVYITRHPFILKE